VTSARALAGVAVALLAAGCAAPVEPLRALAADPRLLVGDVPDVSSVTPDVEVRLVSHLIFWVPTDGQPPTLEDAVAEALRRGRGDVLLNATVERVGWYVPIVYGEYGWIVRGDVMRLRDHRPHRFDLPLEEDADEPALPSPRPRERPADAPSVPE
jgi:hypothetical protein